MHKYIHKLIAASLAVTLIFQSIAWADPDTFESSIHARSARTATLQVQSIFNPILTKDLAPEKAVEALVRRIVASLDRADWERLPLDPTIETRDGRMELVLGLDRISEAAASGAVVFPLSYSIGGVTTHCTCVVGRDKSVALADRREEGQAAHMSGATSAATDTKSSVGRDSGGTAIRRFIFRERTSLENITSYLSRCGDILCGDISDDRWAELYEAVKKQVSQLEFKLQILLHGRQHGHEPCLGCVNKGACPVVAAMMDGTPAAEDEEDNGCGTAKRCLISYADAAEALTLAGKYKAALEGGEKSRVIEALKTIGKESGGAMGRFEIEDIIWPAQWPERSHDEFEVTVRARPVSRDGGIDPDAEPLVLTVGVSRIAGERKAELLAIVSELYAADNGLLQGEPELRNKILGHFVHALMGSAVELADEAAIYKLVSSVDARKKEGVYSINYVRGPPETAHITAILRSKLCGFTCPRHPNAIFLDSVLAFPRFAPADSNVKAASRAAILHEAGESFFNQYPGRYDIANPHVFLRGLGKAARDVLKGTLTPSDVGFAARVAGDGAQDALSGFVSDKEEVIIEDGFAKVGDLWFIHEDASEAFERELPVRPGQTVIRMRGLYLKGGGVVGRRYSNGTVAVILAMQRMKKAARAMFGKDFSELTFLDAGAGTGILGISAAVLGAKVICAENNDEPNDFRERYRILQAMQKAYSKGELVEEDVRYMRELERSAEADPPDYIELTKHNIETARERHNLGERIRFAGGPGDAGDLCSAAFLGTLPDVDAAIFNMPYFGQITIEGFLKNYNRLSYLMVAGESRSKDGGEPYDNMTENARGGFIDCVNRSWKTTGCAIAHDSARGEEYKGYSVLCYTITRSAAPPDHPAGDGFIQSARGRAPEELARIRNSERELLHPAPDGNVNTSVEIINMRIAAFRDSIPHAKREALRDHMSACLSIAEQGATFLNELVERKRIFTFDAIVYDKEDYALGYGSSAGIDSEIGFARELMDIDPILLAECILHEVMCPICGHAGAIQVQQMLFRDSHFDADKHSIHRLRLELRGLINKKASVRDGVDYLAQARAALNDDNANLALLDETASGNALSVLMHERRWDHEIREMAASGKTHVIYGAYSAIENISRASITASGSGENGSGSGLRVVVDGVRGLAGFWGVPPQVTETIKNARNGLPGSLLIDAYALSCLLRLADSGYSAMPIVAALASGAEDAFQYSDLCGLFSTYCNRDAVIRSMDTRGNAGEMAHLQAVLQGRDEAKLIGGVFGVLPRGVFLGYLKKYFIEAAEDPHRSLNAFQAILPEGRAYLAKSAILDALWEIYLDPANTEAENSRFMDVIVLGSSYYMEPAISTLTRIFEIFKSGDNMKTQKAADVLWRIRVPERVKHMNDFFDLLHTPYYRKEFLAAFCLVNAVLYGAGVTKATKTPLTHHFYKSAINDALSPDNASIYYYILKMQEVQRSGGTFTPDTDRQIYRYTAMLDCAGGISGKEHRNWFCHFRRAVHDTLNSAHREIVRAALCYWKDLDDEVVKRHSGHSLIAAIPEIGEEENRACSEVLNRLLALLRERGILLTPRTGDFLDGMLEVPQETIKGVLEELYPSIKNIEEANGLEQFLTPEGRIYGMIMLFYAFNEKYGIVGSRIRPFIKGRPDDAGPAAGGLHPNKMRELVSFMFREYEMLMEVIDSNDHRAVFPAVADCRAAIRRHLLFDKNVNAKEKNDLMELDYQLYLLGREMLAGVVGDVSKCAGMADLAQCVPLIAAAGKFIAASGLGGVDFEELIYQLEKGRLKYSQLRDMTRALWGKTHEIARGMNKTVLAVMPHIWDTLSAGELTEEWRKRLNVNELVGEDDGKRFHLGEDDRS
ncbi:MAG: hypothetical protein ABH885_05910, partial [Candidatus Omnitrophota bacterium]